MPKRVSRTKKGKKKKTKNIPLKSGAVAVHSQPKQQFITNVFAGGKGSRGGAGAYKKGQAGMGVAQPSSRRIIRFR